MNEEHNWIKYPDFKGRWIAEYATQSSDFFDVHIMHRLVFDTLQELDEFCYDFIKTGY